MPDQLSLELPAPLPRLPAELRPMLPRPTPAPFDSPDHLFEPSWGGLRALAFVEWDDDGAASLRLLDARGRDLAPHIPELAALPHLVTGVPAVLDGELVAPTATGHADPAALSARLSGVQSGGSPAAGQSVLYLVFDLLYLSGRPLLGLPLARRRELLAGAVAPGPEVVLVPAVAGAGRDLFEAAAAQGLPGIMARHVRSPYLAGRRSGLWRSVSASPRTRPEDLSGGMPTTARPVLALLQRLPLDTG